MSWTVPTSISERDREGFAMTYLIAPIVIGTLAFAAAVPAAAQTPPGHDQGTTVRLVMTRDPATDRQSYIQKARDEMGVWKQKLQDFGTRVDDKTTAAHAKAAQDLDNAWTTTKAAADRLGTASAEDWNGAKTSYRQALHKLVVAWHNISLAPT